MPLDPEVADGVKALILTGAQAGAALTAVVDRNAVQGLTTVNTNLIHQHGATADDPATMAALQTAAGVPKQGQT